MRILVIGGAGLVAGLVLPLLKRRHTLRVFDLKAPADETLDHVVGDVCDYHAVYEAAQGMDALLYMAMGRNLYLGDSRQRNVEMLTSSLDANVKGVYIALCAAHDAGITHAVYTSSMSVYGKDLMRSYFPDEEVVPDAHNLYGFTKRLGEEVCRNACHAWGMSVNALRLCFPTSSDMWYATVKAGEPTLKTTDTDVAAALEAALTRRFDGFEAFMISGDYEQKIMNMGKAKRLLDWEPLARPQMEAGETGE